MIRGWHLSDSERENELIEDVVNEMRNVIAKSKNAQTGSMEQFELTFTARYLAECIGRWGNRKLHIRKCGEQHLGTCPAETENNEVRHLYMRVEEELNGKS